MTLDNLYHALGGAALTALVLWHPANILVVLVVLGMLREQAQHHDEGWLGWITPHRLVEASSWAWPAAPAIAVCWWLGWL